MEICGRETRRRVVTSLDLAKAPIPVPICTTTMDDLKIRESREFEREPGHVFSALSLPLVRALRCHSHGRSLYAERIRVSKTTYLESLEKALVKTLSSQPVHKPLRWSLFPRGMKQTYVCPPPACHSALTSGWASSQDHVCIVDEHF